MPGTLPRSVTDLALTLKHPNCDNSWKTVLNVVCLNFCSIFIEIVDRHNVDSGSG